MKKLFILLATIISMLLSVSTFAQCDPLETEVLINYNNPILQLPDTLCVTIIWEFFDGKICEQKLKIKPVSIGGDKVSGTLMPLPFVLPVESDCLGGECVFNSDVFKIIVIVSDCKDIIFKVESSGYQNPIYIDYFW